MNFEQSLQQHVQKQGRMAAGVISGANVTVANQSPMTDALDHLRKAHEYMANEVSRMADKYQPAMRPESPGQPMTGNDRGSNGPIVDIINTAADFMLHQAGRLCDYNDRCVL